MLTNRFYQERLQKLTHLLKIKHNPFNEAQQQITPIYEFLKTHEEEATLTSALSSLIGRIILIRNMGKSCFMVIQDESGQLQIYIQKNLSKASYELLNLLDIGDIINVIGVFIKTKSNEKTLKVSSWKLITKSLLPLPEKWHGLIDTEQRYRQRYLDLISNKNCSKIFKIRSKIISKIRSFFDNQGFVEVETPILNDTAGGAIAKPFTTFHNSLNEHLALRIATEINLKKLIVGGFEKVYEIGRIFRNEGLSSTHNPEFTSIEFYQTNATYNELMILTEQLLRELTFHLYNKYQITYQNYTIDFAQPFKKASICQLVGEYMHFSQEKIQHLETCADIPLALDLAQSNQIDHSALSELLSQHKHIYDKIHAQNLFAHILYCIFEHKIEKTLIQPTFLLRFPIATSPLAKKNKINSFIADRFELYCGGMEIANAFSELNNPIEQKNRLESQLIQNSPSTECNAIDQDFINSLEIGMAPTAGEGIGIDRLVMILTNCLSIKDVILFPKMKNTFL